jgi:D-ribose pyranose/furanose isomerase RbsD
MTYTLESFCERNPINRILADNMSETRLLTSLPGQFESNALMCFIRAYNICALLLEKDQPLYKLPGFYDDAHGYAGPWDSKPNFIMEAATLSIVHILSAHFSQDWKDRNTMLRSKLFEHIKSLSWSEEVELMGFDGVKSQITTYLYQDIYLKLYEGTNTSITLPHSDFTNFGKETTDKTDQPTVQPDSQQRAAQQSQEAVTTEALRSENEQLKRQVAELKEKIGNGGDIEEKHEETGLTAKQRTIILKAWLWKEYDKPSNWQKLGEMFHLISGIGRSSCLKHLGEAVTEKETEELYDILHDPKLYPQDKTRETCTILHAYSVELRKIEKNKKLKNTNNAG